MIQRGLFSVDTEYTIDICSLLELFRDDRKYPKEIFKGLFSDLNRSFEEGLIISHIEVYKEIQNSEEKGDALYRWATSRKRYFRNYEIPQESDVLGILDPKYGNWVNEKLSEVNADPWLIAQAKCNDLTIVTEEVLTNGTAPVSKIHIPDVCMGYKIKCINLLGLVKEQGWSYT